MPTDYQTLQRQIAQAESERYAAQRAEQQRLEAEQANKRKIAEQDAALTRMRAQAARMELDHALQYANTLASADAAAVRALRDEMDAAITDLLNRLAAPLAAADLAYKAATAANDNAIAAGGALAQYAAQPDPRAFAGQAEYMAREQQERMMLEAYGQARNAVPAPLLPSQAPLIGQQDEPDLRRRRAWSALYFIMTGQIVEVNEDYDADQAARRVENQRTRVSRY